MFRKVRNQICLDSLSLYNFQDALVPRDPAVAIRIFKLPMHARLSPARNVEFECGDSGRPAPVLEADAKARPRHARTAGLLISTPRRLMLLEHTVIFIQFVPVPLSSGQLHSAPGPISELTQERRENMPNGNWILGDLFEKNYGHAGSIATLWETRWMKPCRFGVYPFHDGKYEDFEPMYAL